MNTIDTLKMYKTLNNQSNYKLDEITKEVLYEKVIFTNDENTNTLDEYNYFNLLFVLWSMGE